MSDEDASNLIDPTPYNPAQRNQPLQQLMGLDAAHGDQEETSSDIIPNLDSLFGINSTLGSPRTTGNNYTLLKL